MSHLIRPIKPRKPKDTNLTIDIPSMHCGVCETTFLTKKNYVIHLAQIREVIFQDTDSEPSFFDSKNRHCKLCDKTYLNKMSFIAHVRRTHHTEPPSLSKPIPSLNDQNNYCIACDKTLGERRAYLNHLAFYHLDEFPELSQGIACKKPPVATMKSRHCVDCKKTISGQKIISYSFR